MFPDGIPNSFIPSLDMAHVDFHLNQPNSQKTEDGVPREKAVQCDKQQVSISPMQLRKLYKREECEGKRNFI